MNATIARLGLRSLTTTGSIVVLSVVPGLYLALNLLIGLSVPGDEDKRVIAAGIAAGLGLSIVVPIVALTAVTRLITAEADDGSILYLVTKPIARINIVATKYVVALGTVVAAGVLVLFLGALCYGTVDVAAAAAVGGLVTGIAFAGIFVVLGFIFKRSVVASLVYFILIDNLLFNLVPGLKWISASGWGYATTIGLLDFDSDDELSAGLPVWYGIVAALITVGFSLWYASRKVANIAVGGE